MLGHANLTCASSIVTLLLQFRRGGHQSLFERKNIRDLRNTGKARRLVAELEMVFLIYQQIRSTFLLKKQNKALNSDEF